MYVWCGIDQVDINIYVWRFGAFSFVAYMHAVYVGRFEAAGVEESICEGQSSERGSPVWPQSSP